MSTPSASAAPPAITPITPIDPNAGGNPTPGVRPTINDAPVVSKPDVVLTDEEKFGKDETEVPQWNYDEEDVANGPVVARSHDGNYHAIVNPDGSGQLTMYAHPNALSRPANASNTNDMVVKFPNLGLFAHLFSTLHEKATTILANSKVAYEQRLADRRAEVLSQQGHGEIAEPLETPADLRKNTIAALAARHGLQMYVYPGNDFDARLAPALMAAYEPWEQFPIKDFPSGFDTTLDEEVMFDLVLAKAVNKGDVEVEVGSGAAHVTPLPV